jgi:hypothetical protein
MIGMGLLYLICNILREIMLVDWSNLDSENLVLDPFHRIGTTTLVEYKK